MSRTGTAPERPLFDLSQPRGIAFYPFYRVLEVAHILGISPDKVRETFRNGDYGEVIKIHSQRTRRHRKNYTTILIPHATLMGIFGGNSEVA